MEIIKVLASGGSYVFLSVAGFYIFIEGLKMIKEKNNK